MRRTGHPQSLPIAPQPAAQIPRSYIGQVVYLRPAHPDHLNKGDCQMASARFPHLEWGWRKDQLMKVYKALQLGLLTYAAPAWQPWAAPSRIEQLERCQTKALRVVTGQLKSTPVETPRRDAGICSIATASKRAAALAYDKAHRLPLDHPRRQILAAPSRHSLKRPSWRSAAQASTNHLPSELAHRAPMDTPFSCSWEDSTGVYTLTTWHFRAPKMIPPPTCHLSDTSMSDSSSIPMARRQRGH